MHYLLHFLIFYIKLLSRPFSTIILVSKQEKETYTLTNITRDENNDDENDDGNNVINFVL